MKEKSDFVAVLFARNILEAGFYKTLLEDHDITVLLDQDSDENVELSHSGQGVPVLVPSEQLEEAELVVEQRSEVEEEFEAEFEDFDEDAQDVLGQLEHHENIDLDDLEEEDIL